MTLTRGEVAAARDAAARWDGAEARRAEARRRDVERRVARRKDRPAFTPPADPDAVLTTTEAAAWLGVSKRTALAWAQDGRLPSFLTPGRHRRYYARDVAAAYHRMHAAGDAPAATATDPSR